MPDPHCAPPRSSHPTDHRHRNSRTSRRQGPKWHVDTIDCEPMTVEQHQAAIRALAALIKAWHHTRPKRSKPSTNPGHEPP